ncbi:MAG: Rrf2 family transcriptional regulator [bacterium]|nr:Rrf2 family transcriptional regulator [bacterium]
MKNDVCLTTNEKRSGTLHLTQKVDYGMFLLSAIATQGNQVPQSLQVVADEHHLSFSFLQQVARQLRQAGLLTSVRGKSGGYRLTKSADEISIKEVIEALEGAVSVVDCTSDVGHVCPRATTCTMRKKMKKINDEIKDVLHTKTISHFIDKS